jgi:uncharacterized membrane protein
MPLIITCPDCDKKLRVPDNLLEKKVKCPKCGVMFTATPEGETDKVPARPAPRAREERIGPKPTKPRRPPPPEEDEDYPRRRRPPREEEEEEFEEEGGKKKYIREGWKKVRMGLTLVIIALWILIGSLAVLILGITLAMLVGLSGFIAAAQKISGTGGGMANQQAAQAAAGSAAAGAAGGLLLGCLTIGLLFVLYLAFAVLYVTGKGICLYVPKKKGSAVKGLAIAAFSCSAAWIGLYLLGFAGNLLSGVSRTTQVFGMLGGCANLTSFACLIAGHIIFMLFLRSVCLNIRFEETARAVTTCLIGQGIYIVVCILAAIGSCLFVFAGMAAGSLETMGVGGAVMGILTLIMILVGVGVQVWYILVVQRVRGAVDRYIARSARG